MSRDYRIQNRTVQRINDINIRVSKKKSRYRREKGIELNPIIQTIKPSDFTSREQVEKYIREKERFLNRKTQFVQNKNNVIFSSKAVQRYQKEVERINKLKEREYNRIKNLETQIKGENLGLKVGKRMEMAPKSLFPNLATLTGSLDRFSSEKELSQVVKNNFLEGYFRGNFIRRSDLQYKENFITSLETVFGRRSANLQKYLKRLPLKDFMNVYYETTGTIDIDFVYGDNDNLESRLNTLELTFRMKTEGE